MDDLSPQDNTILVPYEEVWLNVGASDWDMFDLYDPVTEEWWYNCDVPDSVNWGETQAKHHIEWSIAQGSHGSLPYGCYGLWEDPYGIPECFQHSQLFYRAGAPEEAGHVKLHLKVDDNDVDDDPDDSGRGVQFDDEPPFEMDINIWVMEVVNLTWEKYSDNNDLDGCPNNGDMRIFPEKKTPGDTANYRTHVNLKVTLSDPVPEGKTVYVHAFLFDVDDPKYTGSPVDPETPVAYNDNQCNDRSAGYTGKNIGACFGVRSESGQWFAGGRDKWLAFPAGVENQTQTLEVEIGDCRPGNNWKAVASTRSEAGWIDNVHLAADGLNFVDADNAPVPVQCISPMLTVWRTLHLELDSMGYGQDAYSEAQVTLVHDSDCHPGFHAHTDLSFVGNEGRMEGGTIAFFTSEGLRAYEIVDSLHAWGDLIVGPYQMFQQIILILLPCTATAFDDDGAFEPSWPDVSLLASQLGRAYIEVEWLPEYSSQIAFVANVGEYNWDVRYAAAPELETSWDYWVANIVSAYQGPAEKDLDPDVKYHRNEQEISEKDGEQECVFGISVGEDSYFYNNISLVYVESDRDFCAQQPPLTDATAAEVRCACVLHEVGHQFGCKHEDGAIMDPDSVAYCEDGDLVYSDLSIKKIRKLNFIGDP